MTAPTAPHTLAAPAVAAGATTLIVTPLSAT